jgi:hypothetical protein
MVAPVVEKTVMGQALGQTTARVYHMCVDWNAALCLNTFHSYISITDEPSCLPMTDKLKMCFGTKMNKKMCTFDDTEKVLQWYKPDNAVVRATESGHDKATFIVFELDLHKTQTVDADESKNMFFMMDKAAGWHHVLRIYEVDNVIYNVHNGFADSQNKLVLKWQLRPGVQHHLSMHANNKARKRKRALTSHEIDSDNDT